MKSWYSNLWRYSNLKWIFESPMTSESPNLKFKSASLKKFSNSAVKRKFFFKLYCIYNYVNNSDIIRDSNIHLRFECHQRFKYPFEIRMLSEIRISTWDSNIIGDSNIYIFESTFEYFRIFEYQIRILNGSSSMEYKTYIFFFEELGL